MALVRENTHVHQWAQVITTNREHFLERPYFLTEKTHHEAVILYGNYGLRSFPESQLPLFLIIYYSSLFQSKMRADLWEMTYKMKHGNMGWMMINGSYDMCLQKCKGHKHPGGEADMGDTMSKLIEIIYFLMEMLLAHGVSFEEKVRRHGGKPVDPHACLEESTTGKPFVLDLCWRLKLDLRTATLCFILQVWWVLKYHFFVSLLRCWHKQHSSGFQHRKQKVSEEIYLSNGFLKISLDKINDFWMENHERYLAQYQN